MPFTDEEKTEILRFLRYPDWVSLAQSVQLGYPAASEPMYLVVDAFKRMTPTAEGKIRRDICELNAIECQLSQSRTRMVVTGVNGVKFNPSEPKQLLDLMTYWERRLADDLGVAPNPFSQGEYRGAGGAGGINAKVSS
jgi:hypothetical protein